MPSKKDPYSSPAGKVIALFGILLFSGRKHSLGQLAGLLRCSKQTVLRAIEQLEATHQIEVEQWVEGKQKWYRARAPRRKPEVTVDVEAIQHLLLCRDFVWHLLPKDLREEVGRTISHTTVLLPDFEERGRAMKPMGASMPKGAIDYSGKQEVIQAILTGCRERRVCRVSYRAVSSAQAKTLEVAPMRLIAYREGLYARCRLAKALKEPPGKYYDPLLAVHRIESAELTKERFELDEGEESAEPMTFGVMPGKPFPVEVAVSAKAAAYVSERVWSRDQAIVPAADGGVTLKFTATSRLEVLSWVLSFGAEMTLVAPADLREEFKGKLAEMAGQY